MFCYVGLHSYTVVLCLVMRVCNFLILFCTDIFSLLKWHQDTLKFTGFYTNASQPSHLPAYTTDTLRAAIWLQRRWPKAFPAFMTHAAPQFSRSHNAPISKCFSPHKPTLLACIQLQRKWHTAIPKPSLLLPSVMYSIIMSHTHIIIHTT